MIFKAWNLHNSERLAKSMEPSFCINHDEERNKFARRVAGMTEHISSKTKNSEIVLLLPSFPPLTHDPFMINFIIFFAFVISIKSHSLIGSFSNEKIFNPYKGLSYFRGESREFISSHSNKPLVSKTVFKMLFMSLLSLTKKNDKERCQHHQCVAMLVISLYNKFSIFQPWKFLLLFARPEMCHVI